MLELLENRFIEVILFLAFIALLASGYAQAAFVCLLGVCAVAFCKAILNTFF